MQFDEFLSLYQETPIIESSTFHVVSPNPQHLRIYVTQWQKKGYLHPLKAGAYVLDERYRKADVSPLFVANYLVNPSYLSLEFALSYYGLIPEQARSYTSVTTKHGRRFSNVLGSFTYRTVKPSRFFGYEARRDGSHEYLIASPEKALLDYFYLNSGSLEVNAQQLEALRLQNLDGLDPDRLMEHARPFTKKVRSLAELVRRAAAPSPRGTTS